LTRIDKFKCGNAIQYHDKVLPDLKIETAVHYHNLAISHFMAIGDDPESALDENLLAAAVILRFYEEVDCEYFSLVHESILSSTSPPLRMYCGGLSETSSLLWTS